MKVIGALLALVCAGLGALQVYVASQRHAEEFAAARGVSKGILSYEFAASPARLRELIAAAGERGREALKRCLEIDYLIIAGYVFVALGLGGFLTAVSRAGLGRFMIAAALLAAMFDLIENAALRQATRTHPSGGSTAPIATVAASLKFALLVAAVAAFFLWPFRTWFG